MKGVHAGLHFLALVIFPQSFRCLPEFIREILCFTFIKLSHPGLVNKVIKNIIIWSSELHSVFICNLKDDEGVIPLRVYCQGAVDGGPHNKVTMLDWIFKEGCIISLVHQAFQEFAVFLCGDDAIL